MRPAIPLGRPSRATPARGCRTRGRGRRGSVAGPGTGPQSGVSNTISAGCPEARIRSRTAALVRIGASLAAFMLNSLVREELARLGLPDNIRPRPGEAKRNQTKSVVDQVVDAGEQIVDLDAASRSSRRRPSSRARPPPASAEPRAERTITGVSGRTLRTRSSRPRPSRRGMLRSVSTRSGCQGASRRAASSPSAATAVS